MRHIYVKTPDGYGKLVFYDKALWFSPYIVNHYEHKSSFISGKYKGVYLNNVYCYRKDEVRFLRKRPLIDLITKRKE